MDVLNEKNVAAFATANCGVWASYLDYGMKSWDKIEIHRMHEQTEPDIGELIDLCSENVHSSDITWERDGNTFTMRHSRPNTDFKVKIVFLAAAHADPFVKRFMDGMDRRYEGILERQKRNELLPEWLKSRIVYPGPRNS